MLAAGKLVGEGFDHPHIDAPIRQTIIAVGHPQAGETVSPDAPNRMVWSKDGLIKASITDPLTRSRMGRASRAEYPERPKRHLANIMQGLNRMPGQPIH